MHSLLGNQKSQPERVVHRGLKDVTEAAHSQEPGEPRAQSTLGSGASLAVCPPGCHHRTPHHFEDKWAVLDWETVGSGGSRFCHLCLLSSLCPFSTTTPLPAQVLSSLAASTRHPLVESWSGWVICGVVRKYNRTALMPVGLGGSCRMVEQVENLQENMT